MFSKAQISPVSYTHLLRRFQNNFQTAFRLIKDGRIFRADEMFLFTAVAGLHLNIRTGDDGFQAAQAARADFGPHNPEHGFVAREIFCGGGQARLHFDMRRVFGQLH